MKQSQRFEAKTENGTAYVERYRDPAGWFGSASVTCHEACETPDAAAKQLAAELRKLADEVEKP